MYTFFNYLVLDDIGHGVRSGNTPRQIKQRGSSQGSIQSIAATSGGNTVGPAPTTKPPTPPQVTRTGSKGLTFYIFFFLILNNFFINFSNSKNY